MLTVNSTIYLQVEPNAICYARDFLLTNWNKFKYIITYDDIILNSVPNAVKYIYMVLHGLKKMITII